MRPIVVGSGMGGLCTALILKKNGFDPLIFEKDERIGGSFWTEEMEGYKVDTGLHMLTRGKTGELPVLMKKYIDPEIFQKKFVAQKCYKFYLGNANDPVPRNLAELKKFSLLNKEDRKRFMWMYIKLLRLGRTGTEKYPNMTAYEYVKKYIGSDNMLYFLNGLSWMSTGCNIKEGALDRFVDTMIRDKRFSLGYILKHMRSKSDATEGDWYPIGGSKRVPQLFVEQGLEVKTGSEVRKIIVENGQVTGVMVNGKTYPTDIVIYDGLVKDLPNLIEGGDLRIKMPKYDEYKAVTIWLGFNKKIANWEKESRIVLSESLDSPHWGVFMTDFDPDLAPEGHQLFGMSAILFKDEDELVKEMRKSIEKLLPGYQKHVDMEYVQVQRAEKTLERADNSMWNLPEQRTNIKGLYIVGTDTKAFGSGGTKCADSANRCWEFIRQDHSKA